MVDNMTFLHGHKNIVRNHWAENEAMKLFVQRKFNIEYKLTRHRWSACFLKVSNTYVMNRN